VKGRVEVYDIVVLYCKSIFPMKIFKHELNCINIIHIQHIAKLLKYF
jgi:hypothetical protein